ncbi:hypothetical protein [Changchengzhania lutea]|uniref:hypothetical protein n=1 Tax=Changchengzhania lutea TaxID=2049305 RepID=UPI00115D15E7|nr:hypothetical protein [Changchengzhania lutea]
MKANLNILLILLLTVSLGNAQSINEDVLINSLDSISNTQIEKYTSVLQDSLTIKHPVKKNDILIDAAEAKANIARSSSDIRVYLNRLRKVGNISLLFPKLNRRQTT